MPLHSSEIKLDQTNLFLFIGPGDSGKSYAATSFGLRSKEYGGDDPRPAYLIDTDGRVAALRGRPVVFDAFTNVEGAIGVINRLEELRNKCVQTKSAPFHTLIAPDSFSGFCELAVADCMDSTQRGAKRKLGEMELPTFEDYGYESEAVRKLLWEHLTDLKRYCDVIVTAHQVEKYKKVAAKPGQPAESVPDGYKVLARDKISAKFPTKFDEIYHFTGKVKIISQKSVHRYVCFQDELARTSYPQLAASTEEYDITGKEFYRFWREMISK